MTDERDDRAERSRDADALLERLKWHLRDRPDAAELIADLVEQLARRNKNSSSV